MSDQIAPFMAISNFLPLHFRQQTCTQRYSIIHASAGKCRHHPLFFSLHHVLG